MGKHPIGVNAIERYCIYINQGLFSVVDQWTLLSYLPNENREQVFGLSCVKN